MRKLTPVSSALAALMIVSVLAGCGGGGGIACE
jgi:predicted small lipoprotein YifL